MAKNKPRAWGRWVACGPAFAEGGQGRLYLVVDSLGEFKDEYVLKELKNPNRLDRFNAELEAISLLSDHPNVVPLVDSGIYRDPDKPCFVLPRADRTLEDLIKNDARDIEYRLLIFDKICEGVAYLHTMAIKHRDLKPENVLMFGGEPKITDFGLCLLATAPRVTPSSEIVGSRFYMAPEMEDGKQPNVGFEADVYSLGKLLYYILSGGRIFAREKYRDKDRQLSKVTDDSRFDLINPVFEKSISIDPRRRYANAGEFQKGFRQAYANFLRHPQTTLLKRFGSIKIALQASEGELRSLSGEEWVELLSQAKKNSAKVSSDLLRAACDSLDTKFAQLFAEALLENESQLDSRFIAFGAGRIFCLPKIDVWFHSWLRSDRFSRIAMHALSHADNDVLNAIGKWSFFTLQHCEDVLTKLAENYYSLKLKGRQNFLIASMKSSYTQKEQLLLELSHDENLDNLSIEAVVAGLCACANRTALSRVIELADGKDMDDKLAAIGRGIIQGSSPDIILQLSRYNWQNPVMKVLLDLMNRTDEQEAADNNRMETDEV